MEKIFTIKTSLKEGWRVSKENMLILLGLGLGYMLLSSLVSWIPMGMPPLSVTYIVSTLILILLSWVFSVGYLKICLQAADGEEPSFSAFGETLPRVVPFVLCHIVIMIGYIIGLILLVIPGIYFVLRAQYAAYFIIEGAGPLEAIKKSWELTDGHVLKLIGLWFVYLGIMLLGIVALLVGVFVAIVWVQEIYAYSYRLMQNELALKNQTTVEEVESFKNV